MLIIPYIIKTIIIIFDIESMKFYKLESFKNIFSIYIWFFNESSQLTNSHKYLALQI